MFQGCGTALVTPFRQDQSLDEEALRRLVHRQIEAGIHFLVPCGTTGETPTLSAAERRRVVELVLDAAAGKVPVMAGAGGYDTQEVVHVAKEMASIGVQGLLSVTPYYNKPTPEGLYQHFSKIADATPLPIMLYNVPGRTGCNIDAATCARLATIPHVIGVKEAAGNITQIESSATSTTQRLSFHLMPGMIRSGFFWSVMYAYSRTMSDTNGPLSLPANNADLRGEWGPAPNDMRHFVSGMLNRKIYKGFSLGLMFNANSAAPYNVTTGFDDNGDTVSNDRPAGVSRNSERGASRWDLGARLGWSFGFGGERPAAAMSGPVVVRVGGDGGGGGPSLPGASNKRLRLELYAQVFNLLNHANLVGFSGVQTSPFFGQATGSLPGRRVETGMRFSF